MKETTATSRPDTLAVGDALYFRAAMREAPFPIMVYAEDGEVLLVSRVWEEITGYRQEEIPTIEAWIGKACGDGKQIARDAIDRLYAVGRRVDEGDRSIRTASGEERIWQFSSAPLGSDSIGRRLVVSMALDVTDRKNTERALEEKLHALDERVKEIICLYAVSNLVENEALSWEEICQKTVDLIPPAWQYPNITCARIRIDDSVYATANFQESSWHLEKTISVQGKAVGAVEVFYREERPDADEGPFTNEERSLIDAVAQRIGTLLERALAEQALRRSEDRFRFTFENAGVGIAHVGLDGRARLMNPKFYDILGYSHEEMAKIAFGDITHPDDQEGEDRLLQSVLEGKIATYSSEKRCTRKDGSTVFVNYTVTLVRDVTGKPEYFVVVIEDIDDRKEAERKLVEAFEAQKRLSAELEEAYTELKRTQSQILQADKMASIGQLAAGVAHEVNNPVGFIMSNLTTLKKYAGRIREFVELQSEAVEAGGNGARAKELANIRRRLKIDYIIGDIENLVTESLEGAQRVKKIVQDLKSFSRVDEAECKLADINECVESTLNIVWNELKYKARVRKDLGDLPRVKCYPQQLNQVFMNLLVNAAHAIEREGEICIRTRAEGDEIVVEISDTGCGMSPEVQERIFEPFFTTKEVGKGTGLGLSITYDIIKKHQGDITVESRPGEGTRFLIRLPERGTEAAIAPGNAPRETDGGDRRGVKNKVRG